MYFNVFHMFSDLYHLQRDGRGVGRGVEHERVEAPAALGRVSPRERELGREGFHGAPAREVHRAALGACVGAGVHPNFNFPSSVC